MGRSELEANVGQLGINGNREGFTARTSSKDHWDNIKQKHVRISAGGTTATSAAIRSRGGGSNRRDLRGVIIGRGFEGFSLTDDLGLALFSQVGEIRFALAESSSAVIVVLFCRTFLLASSTILLSVIKNEN